MEQYSCIAIEQANSSQKWCPTAVHFNGSPMKQYWTFCPSNCSERNHKSSPKHTNNSICQSRNSLESMLRLGLDRTVTHPSEIAEILYRQGCPFSCQYTTFSAHIMSKKHIPKLGRNKVRIKFEFESREQDVITGLDYSLDMFISDIGKLQPNATRTVNNHFYSGTAFGLLLGLSLVDLIRLFSLAWIHVIKGTANLLSRREKISCRPSLIWRGSIGFAALCKWSFLVVFLGYVVTKSFSRDFSNMLQIEVHDSQDGSLDELKAFNFGDDVTFGMDKSKQLFL